MTPANPFYRIVDLSHVLTPIASERIRYTWKTTNERPERFRIIDYWYVFGIRVAYRNITKWD